MSQRRSARRVGSGIGLGFAVGIGVGFGVGVGFGFGIGIGIGIGVGFGFGVGFGIGVGFGFAVGLARSRACLLPLLCASLLACRSAEQRTSIADDDPPPAAPSLETFTAELLALPSPALERKLTALQLDAQTFGEVIAAPYDRLYSAYAARFSAAVPAFAAELRAFSAPAPAPTAAPALTVRRHYADDTALSLSQRRLRWALPVQAESWVVARGEVTLDAVWLTRRGRWFLLLGLDEAARAALAAAAPDCAALAVAAGRAGVCSDAIWVAQDAALRDDAERLIRACQRAVHFCH